MRHRWEISDVRHYRQLIFLIHESRESMGELMVACRRIIKGSSPRYSQRCYSPPRNILVAYLHLADALELRLSALRAALLNASFIEIIIRETAQRQLGVRLLSEATINKNQYVLCSLFVFHRRVSFGAQIPKEILHILLSHKSTSPTLDDVGNFTKKALCQASGMKDCSSTSAL